ncbi:amidohydrolase family protein [Chelativorans xinjiangense]|uniref:amidohydrolase family protein n=1 Tax=Chelativorans xinjiangense TaxID=2681485 RepID=UPI0013581E68|nr:amidohydrolase family protein [Chelativorans xinjiangense]
MTSFLIRNAVGILTGLNDTAARAAGDIRVRDGKIAAIGELRPLPGERIIDASNAVVTPGLVNTHHHLFQSVLKAVPEGMNEALAAWLRLVPYSYWDRIDEEALRVSAMIGLAELVLSGATTVADHHYFYSDRYEYDPGDVLFETTARFGVRFVLARGGATKGRKFDGDDIAPVPVESLTKMIDAVAATARRWHDPSPDAMRRVAFAPTTPTFSLGEPELKEVASAARAMGLRLHSHLSENMDYVAYTLANYGKRPVHWLAEHDWLGPDVWFAHLVECAPDEVRLLAETGTAMAHCPQANARLGSGIAPAATLDALGGTVSLAVDGAAANEAADMASALYAAFAIQRAANGVGATTAESVLRWASAEGAKALGFDAIGTIEVGKHADIAIFDLGAPRYFGQHDRVVGPIVSGGEARVRHSFVGGRALVENYRIPWLDLAQLDADAARVVGKIAKKTSETEEKTRAIG